MEILLILSLFLFIFSWQKTEKKEKEDVEYIIPRNPYTKYKEYKNFVKDIDITFSTILGDLPGKKLRYVSDRARGLLFSPINTLPLDICPVSVDGMRYKIFSGQQFDKKFLLTEKYLIKDNKLVLNPKWKKTGLSEKDRKIILRIDGSSEYSLDELDEIFSYDFIAGIELNLYSKYNTMPKFIMNNIHVNDQNELLKNRIREILNLPNFKSRKLIFGIGISYFNDEFMSRLNNTLLDADFIHFYKSDLSKDVLNDLEKSEKYFLNKKHIIVNDDSFSFKKILYVVYRYKISGISFSVRNFKFHHKYLNEFIEDFILLKKKIGF